MKAIITCQGNPQLQRIEEKLSTNTKHRNFVLSGWNMCGTKPGSQAVGTSLGMNEFSPQDARLRLLL